MSDNFYDRINEVDLKETMERSYIAYAMSVIASRALPDVRDGLKPVQRRILHSMVELNNGPDKPHRKCARIVGDTMGKYHPHGDSSIYGALVNMAQEWSTRYPLVDGHGNFGSVDGDGAAAMRYTEARLSKISTELIADINKDTVDFIPNFDETEKEPAVLPARFPNLLVNGTTGIAVGMATNIPPHNLGETIDAVVKIIDDKIEGRETTVEDLLPIIKGPDFPTGGTILGTRGIKEAYTTGRGKIRTRAVCEIETLANGKSRIIVSELPFMVNKARLIEKIAELVKDKRVDGITDLSDQSSREGMRICIDIRRDANANVILNQLYKHTQLQDTFGVIMLALVGNEPKIMNLKEILTYYLSHQEEVVTRRTKYDLNKAKERCHILEGLLIALDNIDEVIRIIRGSENAQTAQQALIVRFDLSEAQARAIVDMRLRALTGLERDKIETEHKELVERIAGYEAILADHNKLLGVIREEIIKIRDIYGDERRTTIGFDDELTDEDLIPDENVVVTMTQMGYIKRMSGDTFRSQNRGGMGIRGMATIEDDIVSEVFMTRTHNELLFFTNFGRVYRLKGYEIPEASRTSRGTAIINLLQLQPGETVTAGINLGKEDYDKYQYLLMATKNGIVKKTNLEAYANVRKNGLTAIDLRDGDELIEVKMTDNERKVYLVTRGGYSICFKETDVRPMGRVAMGVKGISLRDGDEVIAMQLDSMGSYLLTASENGIGKLTELTQFNLQKRGGLGLKCYRILEKTGKLIAAIAVEAENDILMVNSSGTVIRISCDSISVTGRITSGVKLINLKEGQTLTSIGKVREDAFDEEEAEGDDAPEAEEVQNEASDK